MGYRLSKFLKRNKGPVVAASLVLLALLSGVVSTTWGLFEARKQRGVAIARRIEAEKRLAQRDKANEILLSIFKDLNPTRGENDDLPLSDRLGKRLDFATSAIEEEATEDVLGVARMQLALAGSQIGLGNPEKAIVLLTKARATFMARGGADDSDSLSSANLLGEGYRALGDLDRACHC